MSQFSLFVLVLVWGSLMSQFYLLFLVLVFGLGVFDESTVTLGNSFEKTFHYQPLVSIFVRKRLSPKYFRQFMLNFFL